MTNLMKWLEPSIKSRIEELNATVEYSPDVEKMAVDNDDKFDALKKIIPAEHFQLLLDVFYNYGCQIVAAEDTYYRKGFIDGMQLQLEINALASLRSGVL